MPIKKDATGKRWVEMETVIPGTPEQVWEAIATGAGNTAWFTNTTIEERVGGEVRFNFGPNGTSTGEVTTWEPPHRFGYVERNWMEGAPAVATEITITSRAGDKCVVRMVHSLFSSSDDWDEQMEGFEKGWPSFFGVLHLYLTHFAGRCAASFVALTQVEGDHLAIWKQLKDQLGLARADAGEQMTTAPEPEALSGVIEGVQQQGRERVILMRVQAPGPGAAMISTYEAGPRVNVSVILYFYGDGAASRAAVSHQKWQAWLDERFALEPAR